ncbi:hypothetical protein [Mycobacterium sp. 852014-50255_SCH5639931]|uniref:hypothetical protein n=1 Tax=Mycobacterium sp. 852014-50255_SCH5639931 TaxID=1834112 RepID=UPI0012E82D1D|nr:hypothetical protein [Mycobacterium sp. 852014-50255_SCH5639931]
MQIPATQVPELLPPTSPPLPAADEAHPVGSTNTAISPAPAAATFRDFMVRSFMMSLLSSILSEGSNCTSVQRTDAPNQYPLFDMSKPKFVSNFETG